MYPPQEEFLEYLAERLDPVIELKAGEEEPPSSGTRILIAGRPKEELLKSLPDLQTLIIPWSGLPDVTRDLMLRYPQINVHNLHHNDAPVAELALALFLAAAKFVIPLDKSLRAGDWRPRYQASPSLLLKGKTALILGYGAIGQRLSRACAALDMSVIAVKRRLDSDRDASVDGPYALADLPELLPRTHALFVCLPHTPETEGIIGKRELEALPKGAILVNVGRGAVVDQQALYHALKEGHLAGAGIDVWYNYPGSIEERSHTPPSDYPLSELENVVMSPHRGGATSETNYLRMDGLVVLLNAASRGEAIPNPVDVVTGY